MGKVRIVRPLFCEMKKDGTVKPANQQKHDRCLPPRLTIQSRMRGPLRKRCGLCKITHCVRLWRMRLAYANATPSAMMLAIGFAIHLGGTSAASGRQWNVVTVRRQLEGFKHCGGSALPVRPFHPEFVPVVLVSADVPCRFRGCASHCPSTPCLQDGLPPTPGGEPRVWRGERRHLLPNITRSHDSCQDGRKKSHCEIFRSRPAILMT